MELAVRLFIAFGVDRITCSFHNSILLLLTIKALPKSIESVFTEIPHKWGFLQ